MEDEEGLYDCVYGEDEGGEVYEDLMKAEEAHQPVCSHLPYVSSYFECFIRTVIPCKTDSYNYLCNFCWNSFLVFFLPLLAFNYIIMT